MLNAVMMTVIMLSVVAPF